MRDKTDNFFVKKIAKYWRDDCDRDVFYFLGGRVTDKQKGEIK